MKQIVVVSVAAVLGACAVAERVPGPGPQASYAISCPALDLGVCFAKAREVCPSGYTVVSTRRPDSPLLPTVFQDQVVVACQ